MNFILYLLLALVILLLMVVIHEFGHYVAGKLLKFKINEFSVGFGPKILQKKKKNGELFSLRAVPLGGYCAFEGEESDSGDPSEKAFVNEKPWKRIIVFLAGAFFNFVSAIVFSFVFILAIGYSLPKVSYIYTDAEGNVFNEEIKVGDTITAVNGKRVTVMDSYNELIAGITNGKSVTLTILRAGSELKVEVQKKHVVTTEVDKDFKPTGKPLIYDGFGFISSAAYVNGNAGDAFIYSVPFTLKMSWSILGTFGGLITGQIPITSLTGPAGTIGMIADLSMQNWRNILILLPLIASNLAIFNLLPIPALDGSKVVFTVIEWIRGKPVNRKVENTIHSVGLIVLFAFVIIIDIVGFILR